MSGFVALAELRDGRAESVTTSVPVTDGYGILLTSLPMVVDWYEARATPDVIVHAPDDVEDRDGQHLHVAGCLLLNAVGFDDGQLFADLLMRPEPHWQRLRVAISASCPAWKRQQLAACGWLA